MTRTAANMSMTARLRTPAQPAWQTPVLHGCGRFTMTANANRRFKRQSIWILEMFTVGRLSIGVESGEVHRVEPGMGVLYAPLTRYREIVSGTRQCQSVAVLFDPGDHPALLAMRAMAPRYRLIDDPKRIATTLLESIVDHFGGRDHFELQAIGDFHRLLAMLPAAHWTERSIHIGDVPNTAERTGVVSRARKFMADHLNESVTIARLATHANMSESGFAHAYRHAAGASPISDLRRMRVDAVKVHLLRNRMGLKRIAMETGFADAFHLSHVFRRVTGVSPREFRRAAGAISGVLE